MKEALLDLVMAHDELAELDAAARRLALRSLITQRTETSHIPALLSELADEIDGFGPVSSLMREEGVTDVLINGRSQIWVERGGRLERSDLSFASAHELRAFIDRLLGRVGARRCLSSDHRRVLARRVEDPRCAASRRA